MLRQTAAGALLLLTLLAAGCGGDAAIYDRVNSQVAERRRALEEASAPAPSVPATEEEAPLSGHLTVKVYWEENMDLLIREFTALHPGVTVDLIQPARQSPITFDDYHRQTAVELMSGAAADLVDVNGFAVSKYAESGVFCDLYSLMDADPDFCREDYYTNIFAAMEHRGALYSMPCAFSYDMLYASAPLLAAADAFLPEALDCRGMWELHRQVLASGASPRLLPGLSPYTFFYCECPDYYDTDARTARFSDPAFLDYLRFTKENFAYPAENDLTRLGYDDSFLREDYLFCRFDLSGGSDLTNFLFDHPNTAGPVPMVSSSGRACFRAMREYAIPAGSPNRELAWAFLRFCVEEREPPAGPDAPEAEAYLRTRCAFIPINKANFFASYRFAWQWSCRYFEADPGVRWRQGDREAMIEEALAQIHRWNGRRDTLEAPGEIYGLLCEDLDRYYLLDLLTPEETARRLQDRMTIFLQE